MNLALREYAPRPRWRSARAASPSALNPDAPVPESAWRWMESAQHRLLRNGAGELTALGGL